MKVDHDLLRRQLGDALVRIDEHGNMVCSPIGLWRLLAAKRRPVVVGKVTGYEYEGEITPSDLQKIADALTDCIAFISGDLHGEAQCNGIIHESRAAFSIVERALSESQDEKGK